MPNIDKNRTKNLPHQVLKKFPDRTETIKAFFDNSPTFGEICDDYLEIVTWIEKNCPSGKQDSNNCDYARELLKDLETEIIDCLDNNNKLVNDECEKSARK